MSQSATAPQAKPQHFNLIMDHMVILVSDMQRSMTFYSDLLPMIGFRYVRDWVFANEQGIYLDFREAKDLEPGYRRYAPGLNHVGFTATSLQQILTVREQMQALGYEMPELQEIQGAHAIFIKDPDGMRVEITLYPEDETA